MAIQVTCPGCHTRFKVSDKFAGQEGACPKCKGKIAVPKPGDEVVIHAPEHSESGAVGTSGKNVLKPIARKDTKFQPLVLVGVGGAAIVVFVLAYFLRNQVSLPILAVGAALLGPPLAYGGYGFLRDAELEPYKGKPLLIRSLICGLAYAVLWGVYQFVKLQFFGDAATADLETWQVLALAAFFIPVGAFVAYVTLDLDPGSGFFHYALYLLVTILLRMTMGMPVV